MFSIKKSFTAISCITGLLIFSGCSRYQYVLVGSRLPQNEKQEFVLENDTIQIIYSFSGRNFPLTITVLNKLAQPLYFDLQRTTVIMNNVQSNVPDLFEGQSDFIAPQAYASIRSLPLKDTFFKQRTLDSLCVRPILTSDGKKYMFNEDTSPLFMRVILALSPYEDYSMPTFYDYSFWTSEVTQSSVGPNNPDYKPAYQFYLKKTTGFGNTMSWVGIGALIIAGGALGIPLTEEEE